MPSILPFPNKFHTKKQYFLFSYFLFSEFFPVHETLFFSFFSVSVYFLRYLDSYFYCISSILHYEERCQMHKDSLRLANTPLNLFWEIPSCCLTSCHRDVPSSMQISPLFSLQCQTKWCGPNKCFEMCYKRSEFQVHGKISNSLTL